jgi:AcrR family transcriptional regulator
VGRGRMPVGRRERAKRDKRERIMAAARELFAERGVSGVTTQQIADRADVAIGTLYRYAATKAELLIMVQNEKFAAAIDDGLAAANAAAGRAALEAVVALVRPVLACVREHVENGRMYLHELVFGDPAEPYRRAGLVLAARLEDGITGLVVRDEYRLPMSLSPPGLTRRARARRGPWSVSGRWRPCSLRCGVRRQLGSGC